MRLLVLACTLQALFLWIRHLGDLREHVVETITVLLIAGLFYLVSCYLVLRPFNGTRSRGLAGLVLCASGLFRLTVWPLAPALSDDPFRYRWEGKLQAAGGNPYEARPSDAQWVFLRDDTFPRVAGRDFRAGYGPLIEQVERWTYRAVSRLVADPARQVFWFKLPYALCDLTLLLVLWGWLRERALIYGWSPLAVMEFWATGHNDALAVLLVVLALAAAKRERWVWACVALGLATAAKFWPALLFPIFIDRKRWWQWSVALPILAALAWPYRTDVWDQARFMTGFVGGWRNNDSLFGILHWLVNDIYRAKYLTFGIIFATVAAVSLWRPPRPRAALWILCVTLMVSANCHPWYLTWILPLLAIVPVPALLLWTVLVPLAYSSVIMWVQFREWHGSTWVRWYEYIPVYGMLLGSWIARRVRL